MKEQELRRRLVDAIRMLERVGHIDFNGHGSVRLPGEDRVLINERTSSRYNPEEKDIITVDLEGNVLEGDGAPPGEYALHAAIYRRRPDVGAVLHTHPQWSTLLTIAGVPWRAVVMQGAVLGPVPVFPKAFSINRPAIADEVAEALGEGAALLLRSHGAVLVGRDLTEAFVRSIFLEENAYRLYMASQVGTPQPLSEEEEAAARRFLWQPPNIEKVWLHYRSRLD